MNPANDKRAIGIDIGGTKISAGVVSRSGEILDRVVACTPRDDGASERICELLIRLATCLMARNSGVVAIGVGAAGLVEWPRGVIRWAPNNAYRSLPLRDILEASTRLPVTVDNDANVAAWGEHRVGQRPPVRHLLFMSVGTGVGAGMVLADELFRGGTGTAGEIGHMIVDPHGDRVCGCGNSGCLESVASGIVLESMGRAAAHADPGGLIARLAVDPESVTGHTLHAAAKRSDPTALEIFDHVGSWLGVALASLVNALDFERVVLGGGMVASGEFLLAPMSCSYRKFAMTAGGRDIPPIALSRFMRDASLVGAAILALDQIHDPNATEIRLRLHH